MGIPVTVEPTEVEPTPPTVTPQSRDTTAQVDLGNRAETDDRIFPLLFGIDFPEGEDVADLARFVAVFLHQPDGFFGRDATIEMEELPFPLAELIFGDGESLLRQVAVRPAVVAGADAIGMGDVRLDGHELVDRCRNHGRFCRSGQQLDLEVAGENPECLIVATHLLDQRVELASGEILGCEIGHDVLLGLLCPLESSPHPETLGSGILHHSF